MQGAPAAHCPDTDFLRALLVGKGMSQRLSEARIASDMAIYHS